MMKKLLAFALLGVSSALGHTAVKVRLADFGGTPSATPVQISEAFAKAFAALKAGGGGELFIAPGEYNFGDRAKFDTAVLVYDLKDVTIQGYGAKFVMKSVGDQLVATPTFFRFQNPENVTVKGLSFTDTGTNLKLNWFGAHCIVLGSTERHTRFRTVDCRADNVVSFFSSQEYDANKYTFENVDIQATVSNAYYGVNANYNCRFSKCDLVAKNVRRAVIMYGPQDWDIKVRGTSDGVSLGSNGFIELVPDEASVERVKVDLTMTGNLSNYLGLVHFYNQGPLTNPVQTLDVSVTVKYVNAITGASNMFIFDHEYPVGTVPKSSPRTYRRVSLSGSVTGGSFTGKVIRHPTLSTGEGNSITVSPFLAALQNNLTDLPMYFRIAR